jgi:hypothetical protein
MTRSFLSFCAWTTLTITTVLASEFYGDDDQGELPQSATVHVTARVDPFASLCVPGFPSVVSEKSVRLNSLLTAAASKGIQEEQILEALEKALANPDRETPADHDDGEGLCLGLEGPFVKPVLRAMWRGLRLDKIIEVVESLLPAPVLCTMNYFDPIKGCVKGGHRRGSSLDEGHVREVFGLPTGEGPGVKGEKPALSAAFSGLVVSDVPDSLAVEDGDDPDSFFESNDASGQQGALSSSFAGLSSAPLCRQTTEGGEDTGKAAAPTLNSVAEVEEGAEDDDGEADDAKD